MDEHDFNTLCQDLARQIKIARQQVGLSQEGLALLAEVDRTYVSQLERGVANPSLLIICRLARAMNLAVELAFIPPAHIELGKTRDTEHR